VKQEQDAALVVMWCGDRARECDSAKPAGDGRASGAGAYCPLHGCVIFLPWMLAAPDRTLVAYARAPLFA
jgi:hypothetical protein